MSTEQPTLSDFHTTTTQDTRDYDGARYGRPQPRTHDADATDVPYCLNCETHVSNRFRRVLGDNKNRAWACHNCANAADIHRGAVANPDYESRVATARHQRGDPE